MVTGLAPHMVISGTPTTSVTGSAVVAMPAGDASTDPLLGLLLPGWQLVIGFCVALVVVIATARLVRRGRSRMGTAMLVTAVVIVAVSVLGTLATGR